MDIEEEDYELFHYGIARKSGRYPWGSGKTPYERATSFQGMIKDLRSQGLSDTEIAEGFGMSSKQLRDTVSYAGEVKKASDKERVRRLKEDRGLSNVAIGKRMGINESSVRSLLKAIEEDKQPILTATTDMLRNEVKSKKYVDVGAGVNLDLKVSYDKFKTALNLLEEEGYALHRVPIEQLGTGKNTTVKVLAAPGTTWGEVYKNRDQIKMLGGKSDDGGRTYDYIMPPISIDSKRVKVRYAEEGGTDADGVIYVRRGVKDVSLGKSSYAQVRVAVDGTHYLKGMAMYRDDLPDGVDLMFNTNKKNTGNKLDAMKPMKKDPTDPFGSMIADQVYEKNPDGTYKRDAQGNRIVESAMNIVNKEGNWDEWSKTLSSQLLSKQKPSLARDQLDLAYQAKKREFDEIMSLTNPTLQRHLLEKFAESADSAAVHLKAAHLPRQATKVILPLNSLRENEVYAPSFNNGEKVALVRFPHGHVSEIPILTVNNNHRQGRDLLGNAPDAIGIHSKVAERLSGADFDGDTVLVIPNNLGKIKNKPPLEALKGFDPQSYKIPEGSNIKKMTKAAKGKEMGKISNLITDMTIMGAPDSEIVRAVKHSMVVIDAEKHGLDYRRSAVENGIAALTKKYQRNPQGGASTIVSSAKSRLDVPDRALRKAKDGGPIDPKTGKLVYVETGNKLYSGKDKTIQTTKLAETDDAHTLVSAKKTHIETIYADHSNRLKDLANQARKTQLQLGDIPRSPSAAKVYAEEVKDLDAALREALRNAPRERQAQLIGNAVFKQKKEAYPDLEDSEIKKLRAKSLNDARIRVGAKKQPVTITPRQWEAIQAGAISKTKLETIFDNTDVDHIKELAMPKDRPALSEADKKRAAAMLRNDQYTLAEVANQLGVKVSTLASSLSGDQNE